MLDLPWFNVEEGSERLREIEIFSHTTTVRKICEGSLASLKSFAITLFFRPETNFCSH